MAAFDDDELKVLIAGIKAIVSGKKHDERADVASSMLSILLNNIQAKKKLQI